MNSQKMDQELPASKPILVYFKARGFAQVVRCVLFEIGVDFEELFVGHNGYLDPELVKKYQIDLKNLPYYIDGSFIVFGIFPIIKYLCTKHNRTDLLGKNFEDQVKVAQFMVKEMKQKGIILNTLLMGIKEVHQKNLGQKGLYNLTICIMNKVQQMKSIDRTKQMIYEMFQRSVHFVNGYLTVMDFAIYERTFYIYHLKYSDIPQLQIPKKYYQFFIKTDFYAKHGSRLSNYKVFFPELDCQLNKLIAKMWKQDITCKKQSC